MIKPLASSQLYHPCDLEQLNFDSAADLAHLSESIGQERALGAIEFGVGMPHEGFNLYVMGSTGLGRHTLVRDALSKERETAKEINDWCYVANFQQPHTPHVLTLPAGAARQLHHDMRQLVEDLLDAIPAAFEGDEYRRRAKESTDNFKEKEDEAATRLGQKAAQKSIVLLRGPTGFTLTPEKEGKVLSGDDFEQLPGEEQRQLGEAMKEIKDDLKESMSQLPLWQQEMHRSLKLLDRETMELTVSQFISKMELQYSRYPKVVEYLGEVKRDIIENSELFRRQESAEESAPTADDPEFNRYTVNTLVDNAETQGPPMIFEDHPTYQNLIGRIEHLSHHGTLQTNFTLIKAGALHRANGGYLILDAEKLLTNPFAWDGLKRALKSREIRIESLERQLSLVSTISLEPQPIPINLKVILIGSRYLYYMLKEYDPEFGLLFKVTADFTEQLSREGGNELLFARLIATLQHREGLRDISRDGIARIIEHSSREAWDGEKLSLHMASLINLLQEADYCAGEAKSDQIRLEDVQAGIDAQEYRSNQLQEQIREQVLRGTLSIDTSGSQLAQVNGLSVLQLGDHSFGAPTRISATARIGGGEMIDISRETEQGGPIHSKGVLILTSYLGERYAKHQPLSVSASLVFEQTYGQIEGDSASAAELCALLSALGDLPIKQSMAITGSINQHGQVQAIGGVCEKIEGFFEICKARGLSGKQGVIIPETNVKDLMLKREVIEAAEQGLFNIYAIKHVEEAMELLTGLQAGVPNAQGIYPEGSINYRIQLRLAEWIALRQHYAGQMQMEVAESQGEEK
ncbi:MAG: ATP-binding protein [Sedimenticola sp.]